MKCDRVQDLFSDHLEGTLERPMAVAFDQHLAECRSCAHDYTSFKTTWQMLETLPDVAPPPGFAYEVVMRLRLEREAARRAKSRWQTVWGEVFKSRVPARVFAGAVGVFLLFQLVLHTPLKGVITAWLLPPTVTATGPWSDPLPSVFKAQPAELWLHSGLRFELAPSSGDGAASVFTLLLKADGVTKLNAKVYVMERGRPRFDDLGISRANLIWQGDIGDSGQPIPFVLSQTGEQDVMTALVEWEHRKVRFAEAVFVPTQMSAMGTAVEGSVQLNNIDLYAALQNVSAAFGAVILVNADISGKVTNVTVVNGRVEDALWKISTNVGLRWRQLGAQVYIVERKID